MDRERHGVVVPLWYERRATFRHALIPGNPAYLTCEGWSAVAKARREEGSTTSTMMRTATTSSTPTVTRIAAAGAMTTDGAPKRKLSTQTTIVDQWLHAFISHNPTATTGPTMPE